MRLPTENRFGASSRPPITHKPNLGLFPKAPNNAAPWGKTNYPPDRSINTITNQTANTIRVPMRIIAQVLLNKLFLFTSISPLPFSSDITPPSPFLMKLKINASL